MEQPTRTIAKVVLTTEMITTIQNFNAPSGNIQKAIIGKTIDANVTASTFTPTFRKNERAERPTINRRKYKRNNRHITDIIKATINTDSGKKPIFKHK